MRDIIDPDDREVNKGFLRQGPGNDWQDTSVILSPGNCARRDSQSKTSENKKIQAVTTMIGRVDKKIIFTFTDRS